MDIQSRPDEQHSISSGGERHAVESRRQSQYSYSSAAAVGENPSSRGQDPRQ